MFAADNEDDWATYGEPPQKCFACQVKLDSDGNPVTLTEYVGWSWSGGFLFGVFVAMIAAIAVVLMEDAK